MDKLKHTLLFILVLCTLTSSSAWAYAEQQLDAHGGEHQHHVDDQSFNSEPAIDHCNHLSAHIIGLLTDINFSFSVNPFALALDVSDNFISFIPLVYLKPPSV
ncbi:hypothetical protein A9Q82_06810 [Cycloclasticus sp. 46_120_T64]|nr:hypothetical protein A9Q82_06810 [Cycloclasticus sp. 46_120_T64]